MLEIGPKCGPADDLALDRFAEQDRELTRLDQQVMVQIIKRPHPDAQGAPLFGQPAFESRCGQAAGHDHPGRFPAQVPGKFPGFPDCIGCFAPTGGSEINRGDKKPLVVLDRLTSVDIL
jgi:hypothetical protein